MDDDVKNLFQKFGQSAAGYQEINRQAETEQAKQRWPLLRDVRVHALPEPEPEADQVALAEPVACPVLRTLPSVATAVAALHAEPFVRSVVSAPAPAPAPAAATATAQATAPTAKAGSLASVFARLAKPNLPVQNEPAVSSFFKKIFQS
ncbi:MULTISPECIES: cellulose biosynthesis protein BcsP [unclassified Undibacterium]|uniref:cellulose biosynthesis protein BcsP n=1 Tax=unclassified Undibacterium TaxID=2630295 RepID=UPI002AC97852|nr:MULTISPECIES: cellulose biosynthesis protein BcsP [unclassified Undibacterium]MEB0137555.1 cellulose biosynthesis protein BcsP [Undibacterium sp. CCC2.1]MEB0170556.1 cellulose biosynthesis protein BcsP [Undibacterium sp. CCC1.1]MEB0174497.1 cellulose biosynthesis protein BcsP [Undibacterium sp. CCC3.4]MEB0213706.1 cellulose biosynthesis protein BcsP [Undibacterium sp. 5I2]WPX43871.1 cellulose biosynthesis protein BcsP [Undibacterium sp. CCC3.4]